MIPASKALSSIEQAILGARRDEDRLTKMLTSATDDAARLRAEQTEAYKALARLKLDELAREDVVGHLDSAEQAAMEALERRKATLGDITDKRAELAAAMEAAGKKREEAADRLAAAVDAVEALTENTRERLTNDSEWIDMSQRVSAAEATAAAATEKASQAEADRDEKRKPYDADPLFSYLWKRRYGTSDYRAGPLVRYGDAKVARLVDYEAARPNYYMLNEIPLRLREHANRLQQQVADITAERQALERRGLEADGIVKLEADVAEATRAHDKADAAVGELEAKLAAIDERRTGLLDGSKDETLNKAIDGLAAAIARDDLATLYKQALATETPEDERIVAKLREIEPTLARREAEAEEVRKAAVELARKRTELERSRDNFHSSGYNQPRGQFADGALIGSIITGVLAGAMSSRNLNDAFGKGFSVRQPPRGGSSFGGGLKFPSRPSMPSRPRGGGGFRTGGRF
jgi:chromosome segregation ATPase